MTEADYEEHGAAQLRHGFDIGPMYVLEVTRSGTVRYEEWADQDFNTPLSPSKTMLSVSQTRALELLTRLTNGDLEYLRQQPWQIL